MKTHFAYIRVSTAKQGTHGVSLTEQKAAIERHAAHTGLTISEWFEERETAARRGRPVFTRMLRLLRDGKAHGLIIHKIDRSARNLKDWADLGDLIDAGVDVHFAADALDLNSRGGRLSADIQAVVAADYIRNLREETRKGFYGRLKQGLYPLAAPVGYLDCGGGKPKAVDPKMAPVVRRVFELYATGNYSLRSLLPEAKSLGLRTSRGTAFSVNGLANMLGNPFYCGIILLRTSRETFQGVHRPIISVRVFERVQDVLRGKAVRKCVRHDWQFRRLIRCAPCKHVLTGERQKGHVYYRCHTQKCPTMTVREEAVEDAIVELFARIQLEPDELAEARGYLEQSRTQVSARREEARAGLRLQLADIRTRLSRLTDALIDGLLDRAAFEERRGALVLEIARIEEQLKEDAEVDTAQAQAYFELAGSLILSHRLADAAAKRRLVEITTSNLSASGKKLAITPSEPFLTLANRHAVTSGCPKRDELRTVRQRSRTAVRAFVDALLLMQFSPDGGSKVRRGLPAASRC